MVSEKDTDVIDWFMVVLRNLGIASHEDLWDVYKEYQRLYMEANGIKMIKVESIQ